MNPELSKYTNRELATELADRDVAKRLKLLERYTPTSAEREAAEREHWDFYPARTGMFVENGDEHPYLVSVHGRWQHWLDNYRSTHNER